MRRTLLVVLIALLFVALTPAKNFAQTAPAPAVNITLGHSAVALNGPWRFHIGDNPQWSAPDFNDSSWETTNLETKEGSYDPSQGTPGFVPGWTGKGHPGYSGFAVCTAALIHTNGSMDLANAGNIAPYLNGNELPIDSGLPLGVTPDSTYSQTTHHLNPGDRLAFISDGVVEATNTHRELFGFDRTQAISNQPAADIADAAQAFGQHDDISVIAVTMQPKPVMAPG